MCPSFRSIRVIGEPRQAKVGKLRLLTLQSQGKLCYSVSVVGGSMPFIAATVLDATLSLPCWEMWLRYSTDSWRNMNTLMVIERPASDSRCRILVTCFRWVLMPDENMIISLK